jgi:LmbE family N-acetylglucosaminyl deacetylase
VQDWAPMLERVPALQRPTAELVIVIAPHPDDETLAAGGAIFDWTRGGLNVQVVVATDGARSHDHRDIARIRQAEALAAAEHLGVAQRVTFLNLPDGELTRHIDEVTEAVNDLIPPGSPTIVLAPRFGDGHDDHDAANVAATTIQRKNSWVQLWTYAVWSWVQESPFIHGSGELPPFLRNCHRWDMSPEAHRAKQRAINEYRSQITSDFGAQIVTDELLIASSQTTEVFWF